MMDEDGWVTVPRPERIGHELEEDRSIWVVFAKTFESERILLRFPDDPAYQRPEGRFVATTSRVGDGEFSLLVRKKETPSGEASRDISYFDAEKDRFVRERHIDTEEHHYILRFSHPSDSLALFSQFADSFEIEQ